MRFFRFFAAMLPVVLAACGQAAKTKTTTKTLCLVTKYSQLAGAVAKCNQITLKGLDVPANKSLDLTKLRDRAKVIFSGTTTFAKTASASYVPIHISGSYITITGAAGHVIDGNGAAYWDGLGSNGGSPKPKWFFVVSHSDNAVVRNLHIKNWPVHCIDITGSKNVLVEKLYMDNRAGDAPNKLSFNISAAHNSDGFGVSSSEYVTIKDSTIINQDDCWAGTSGKNIRVSNLYCEGGHGLSIGSIGGKGGKGNDSISDVLIEDSVLVRSSNGARIKTNYNTTGEVTNITFRNITLKGITDFGLTIRQDYLNGGPTGKPTNGVKITNVSFIDVKGTASGDESYNSFVLCGQDSCENFLFENVDITGGKKGSSCNFPAHGCEQD